MALRGPGPAPGGQPVGRSHREFVTSSGGNVTVKDALSSARARWWLPVLGLALGLAAAAVVTAQTTPLYRSSTQVFVGQTGSAEVEDAYASGVFAEQRALTYVELAEGEDVIGRAADDLGLDLTADLVSRIAARSVPGTGIIEVTVTDPSPDRAQQIAAAVGAAFIDRATALETAPGAVRSAVALSTVRSAERPTDAIAPDVPRNLAFGALAGLLTGLLIAALPTRSTRTVTHRDDVRDWSGAELLATLVGDDRRGAGRRSAASGDDPDSTAFAALRSHLLDGHDGVPPRVVVVTGTEPREQRSSVAAGLATAIARAGHRVALVDADPQRPGPAAALDLPDGPGLTDVLAGRATVGDVLRKAEGDGPDVVPAGTAGLDASAVHCSPVMGEVLRSLRESHDVVLVDSPALTPVPDAAVLGSSVDGCLLVARYGRTGQRELAVAAALLADHGARLLGVVLDGVPAREARARGLRHDYPADEDRRAMLPPVGRRIVAGGGSLAEVSAPDPDPDPVRAATPAEPGAS